MGTAIQADLAAAGIRAKIETYEWNTFLGKILHDMKGVTNMAELSFMSQDPDMHPALTLRGDGGINSGGYSNPKVDELLAAGRIESDPTKRAAIYKQFQDIVNEDAPWIFICNWKQNAVEGANVKGFQLHPSFTLRLWDVYKE